MPEGPEIKLAADKIAKAIVDRPLTEVSFAFDRLKSFEAELTAARIVSVTPKGNAMLTRFSNQLSIYSHNQLYATRGITNNLAIVEQLKQRGQTRRQYRHWVFGRQDCPCHLCHTEILKDTLGGRRVYFCPSCQAKHILF